MTPPLSAVVFDLDDTLVDTKAIEPLRQARRWREAITAARGTTLFDGVSDLIAVLAEKRIPWGILTRSVSNYSNALLTTHELVPTRLVAYHDVRRVKPDPEGVLLLATHFGIEPSQIVGVGDSATDLAAYRAAGAFAAGAGWSPALQEGEWDALLTHPLELVRLFDLRTPNLPT